MKVYINTILLNRTRIPVVKGEMGTMFSTSEISDKHGKSKNLETFSLLWLDAQVETDEENRHAQTQLRNIINYLKTFDNELECEEYISNISPQERVVIIVSGQLGRTIVPRIHHLRQTVSIYIYCKNRQANEQWSKPFTKVFHFLLHYSLISRVCLGQSKS